MRWTEFNCESWPQQRRPRPKAPKAGSRITSADAEAIVMDFIAMDWVLGLFRNASRIPIHIIQTQSRYTVSCGLDE